MTYTDLWQASLRHAELQNHNSHSSFWNAVNNEFKFLCDCKHLEDGMREIVNNCRPKTQPQVDELKRLCGVS